MKKICLIIQIKSDVKNITGVDTSKFSKIISLASLKSKVDELDIDKLKTVWTDLIKLNDLVDNGIFIGTLL